MAGVLQEYLEHVTYTDKKGEQRQGHCIRIVNRDGTPWDCESGGKPWWVLTDVCRAVGIGNAPMVATRLVEDEKDAIGLADSMGRLQKTTIVNRPGLSTVLPRGAAIDVSKLDTSRFDLCRPRFHDHAEFSFEPNDGADANVGRGRSGLGADAAQ
jgi:hypothetical protein